MYKRQLQATRAELTAAQQRVAGLAQQMQTTASPTRAMTREFDRAVRAAQQLKEKQDVYKRQPACCCVTTTHMAASWPKSWRAAR